MNGASSIPGTGSLSIVYCFSDHDEDKELQQQLGRHLTVLCTEGLLRPWSRLEIAPGDNRQQAIHERMGRADLFLLLLSSDYFSCEECMAEMQLALQRHQAGQALVIPILLRPCEWTQSMVGSLEPLPANRKPVSESENLDAAWLSVVSGIRRVTEQLRQTKTTLAAAATGPFLIPPIKLLPSQQRPFILAALHDGFRRAQPPRIQSLYGMHGTCKTRHAVQYAHQHRSDYRAAFAILAESEQTLDQGCQDIAQALGLPRKDPLNANEARQLVQRWLTDNDGWLLILARAKTTSALDAFIPSQARGDILITSDHPLQDLKLPLDGAIRLPEYTRDEALAFFRERTGCSLQGAEAAAAAALAEELGHVPAVLEQAASFLLRHPRPFSVHLQELRQHRTQTLENYPRSMSSLWDLSLQTVDAENPAAGDLLRLSALLNGHRISLDLFARGTLSQMGGSFAGLSSEYQLYDLLDYLSGYSLVWIDTENACYSINRMLQQAVRMRMQDQTQRWAELVVQVVGYSVRDLQSRDWTCHMPLGPQIHAAAELIHEMEIATPTAVTLLHKAGYYLHRQGTYGLAQARYQRALAISEKVAGPRSEIAAESLNGLGRGHFCLGRFREAEQCFLSALAIRRELLRPSDPAIGTSLNNLALLYYHMDPQRSDIEPMFRQALQIRQEALGKEDPYCAKTLNNLGLYLTFARKFAEAERLHLQALALRKNVLGPEHPDVAQSLTGLARLFREKGEFVRAEQLFLQARSLCEAALGLDHPNIAYSISGLAWLRTMQRQDDRALSLFEEARRIWESSLGGAHPVVAKCRFGIAGIHERAERWSEAIEAYCAAVSIWEKTLLPQHPDYVSCAARLSALTASRPAVALPENYLGLSGP